MIKFLEILSKEISQSKHDSRIKLIGPLILEIQQKIAEMESVNHEIVQKDIERNISSILKKQKNSEGEMKGMVKVLRKNTSYPTDRKLLQLLEETYSIYTKLFEYYLKNHPFCLSFLTL